MKKVILFVAVIAATSFASCKKSEHDCTCSTTVTYAGSFISTSSEVITYKDVTKKQAKTLCVTTTTTDDNGAVTQKDCTVN